MPELLHPGVYTLEVPSGVRPIEGVSTSTAAFIGVADKGPIPGTKLSNTSMAQPDLVTSFTEYQRRYGGFRPDSFLTYAVKAFFDNGGRRAYIVRVGASVAPLPKAAAAPAALGLAVSAANQGLWGNLLSIRIADASDGDATHLKLQVLAKTSLTDTNPPAIVESFDNATVDPTDPNYIRTIVNNRSEFIAITADVTTRPPSNFVIDPKNQFGPPTKDSPTALQGGLDGGPPAQKDFIGQQAPDNTVTGTGLFALDKETDVNLIAIPGKGDQATISAGMSYCKINRPLQDCFFIGDVGTLDPKAARSIGAQTDTPRIQDAVTFVSNSAAVKIVKSVGDYGAVYFPWILSIDPIGSGSNPRILLPPSGFLAGIYARVDNSRGVFKAPAGTTDGGVAGALDVATPVSDIEQDRLNPISVNVIRTVPTAGIVVWGTRTIGSDTAWRYIPVRRMAIFLRVSIYYGIQWAVFEPNDEPLWAALRLNIRAFMLTQFRSGAFQGSKPDDAFFVKCDATTTTQQDIDNGVVNILVGFAPLKPAEFVVLKLSQIVNQPAA